MGRILLNLSGGIDSAYCLYDAMRKGQNLLVHHITLTNHEGRAAVEDRATKQVVEWVKAQKLPGAFTYVRSGFDYGTLRFVVKDVAVWAFLTGVILADPRNRDITGVIIPRHHDAFGHNADPVRQAARSDEYLRGFMKLVARREVELLLPIGQMKKADVIRATPRELLDLCWWCRTPKGGRPCHVCITCKVVDPVLATM